MSDLHSADAAASNRGKLTDPRIAALAEALRHALLFHYDDDPTLAYEDAAAILAALPADWCGHEAEIARLRGDSHV